MYIKVYETLFKLSAAASPMCGLIHVYAWVYTRAPANNTFDFKLHLFIVCTYMYNFCSHECSDIPSWYYQD